MEPPRPPRKRALLGKRGWALLVLAALVVSSGIALSMHAQSGADDGAKGRAAEREWGPLSATPFRLLPPPERIGPCELGLPVWHTNESMRERIRASIARMGLTATQERDLRAAIDCPGGGECEQPVARELPLTLSHEARGLLYPVLAELGRNSQSAAFHFRSTTESELRHELPELSSTAFDLLTRMTYRHRGYTAFADAGSLCAVSPPEERQAILRAFNGMPSVGLQMKLDDKTDVGAIARYYHRPDQLDHLRALAQAHATLDVAELLPELARARLFQYPSLEGDQVNAENCSWTALNFLREQPRAEYGDTAIAWREILADYHEIPLDHARFGDLVVFVDGNGELAHAANYVADGVVFTRNGKSPVRPWTLMALADLRPRYAGVKARAFQSNDATAMASAGPPAHR